MTRLLSALSVAFLFALAIWATRGEAGPRETRAAVNKVQQYEQKAANIMHALSLKYPTGIPKEVLEAEMNKLQKDLKLLESDPECKGLKVTLEGGVIRIDVRDVANKSVQQMAKQVQSRYEVVTNAIRLFTGGGQTLAGLLLKVVNLVATAGSALSEKLSAWQPGILLPVLSPAVDVILRIAQGISGDHLRFLFDKELTTIAGDKKNKSAEFAAEVAKVEERMLKLALVDRVLVALGWGAKDHPDAKAVLEALDGALKSGDPARVKAAQDFCDMIGKLGIEDSYAAGWLKEFAVAIKNGDPSTVADIQNIMSKLGPLLTEGMTFREAIAEFRKRNNITNEDLEKWKDTPLAIAFGNPESFFGEAETAIDFDGTGRTVRVKTLNAQLGWLFVDRDGDGLMTSGREMIGSGWLPPGAGQADGFTILSMFDGNNDGVVEAKDPIMKELRVWRDFNQDGLCQHDEVQTLEQAGVVSLSVLAKDGSEAIARFQGYSVRPLMQSTARTVDGHQLKVWDLFYRFQ